MLTLNTGKYVLFYFCPSQSISLFSTFYLGQDLLLAEQPYVLQAHQIFKVLLSPTPQMLEMIPTLGFSVPKGLLPVGHAQSTSSENNKD